jgi:hypothetical protein
MINPIIFTRIRRPARDIPEQSAGDAPRARATHQRARARIIPQRQKSRAHGPLVVPPPMVACEPVAELVLPPLTVAEAAVALLALPPATTA